ncbi:hypothetical protein GCM10007363_15570 [Pseudomonas fluvialis]|uniref:Uncharacterized protein n=1 Tax=Pseudomonas fluvialis TaxID=1793966 RepID=A0ABQ2AJY8_9PSED|nr:hypothetical protein GCM10007363_15570 [Pseudomonas fluvialis]
MARIGTNMLAANASKKSPSKYTMRRKVEVAMDNMPWDREGGRFCACPPAL